MNDKITRRTFLNAAAATTVTIGAKPLFSAPTADAVAVIPPVAVFGKVFQELKLDFQQSAEVTAEAGLEGVDCAVRGGGEIEPKHATEQLPRYNEALAKRGCKILLLTSDITGVDSPHAREVLASGVKAGARFYRLGYWMHRPDVPTTKLTREIIAKLTDLAAMNRELGACALFQNHSSWNTTNGAPVGGDLAELYSIVNRFDPKQIGVAFDLGHALITHGDAWREHYARLKPHIRVVYVKDAKRPDQFVPFGQGEFGGTHFLAMLAKSGYRAPISLHIEYPWAPEGKKSRAALVAAIKQSRRLLGDWWKGA